MTQQIFYIPASRLSRSPANVRKRTDAEADAQLEANIVARGAVLQNLIGLSVPRKKGHYRIIAGDRRLRAVQRAIEAGTLPPDFALPVMPIDDEGDAIEVSHTENFLRLDLNPADACRAFQDIIETENKSPADIARRYGLTERFVLGRLRLANLAEPLFDALADGSLSLDLATAYASTSDQERQAAIFSSFANSYGGNNPDFIRRQLAAHAYASDDPRVLLVGREAYLAAGGRLERDLFTDDGDEAWLDTHIIDMLATTALEEAASEIKAKEGYGEVRPISARTIPYMETCALERLVGEPEPLTLEQEERKARIEAEIAEFEARAACDEGSYDARDEAQVQQLEAELDRLIDRPVMLAPDMRADAIAYLLISADGSPRLLPELYRRTMTPDDEAEGSGEQRGETVREEETVTVQAEPARPVMSQRLMDELAMAKTELLALHIARSPDFARDLGTFFMIDAALGHAYGWEIPSELRAPRPTPRVQDFRSDARACSEWEAFEAGLDRSWSEGSIMIERYEAFCHLDSDSRASWLSWAIARTLHAIPAGGKSSDLLDHLGTRLGIDVSAWWRPTASNFFDRISKPAILDLLGEIGGNDLRLRYAGLRKHDLSRSAQSLFSGEAIVEIEHKDRLMRWLPDAMLFTQPEDGSDDISQDPEVD